MDIIGDVVELKRRGNNYFGLCPFHQEKTPSFSVSRYKQKFYCFGCHAGGDALTFVQRYYNLSFHDALAWLAERAGLTFSTASDNNIEKIRTAQAARKRQIEAEKRHQAELKAIENELVAAEKRCHAILQTVLSERDLNRDGVTWAVRNELIIEDILDRWLSTDDAGKLELVPIARMVEIWP